MKIIHEAKEGFNREADRLARANVIRKLRKQGIDPDQLLASELEDLIEDEKKILATDAKKVGIGVGVGIAISLLTGI